MTSIVRFAPVTSAFDPEATRILGKAFDMACALVGRTAQPTATREAIARAIVEAAQQGEYDPHRLRDAALAALDPIDRQKPDRHPRDV
jgi:ribosomal protein S9